MKVPIGHALPFGIYGDERGLLGIRDARRLLRDDDPPCTHFRLLEAL
ncbi:MAG: hypothetical protein AAFV49_22955 [Pseudomonadota bacterium]